MLFSILRCPSPSRLQAWREKTHNFLFKEFLCVCYESGLQRNNYLKTETERERGFFRSFINSYVFSLYIKKTFQAKDSVRFRVIRFISFNIRNSNHFSKSISVDIRNVRGGCRPLKPLFWGTRERDEEYVNSRREREKKNERFSRGNGRHTKTNYQMENFVLF